MIDNRFEKDCSVLQISTRVEICRSTHVPLLLHARTRTRTHIGIHTESHTQTIHRHTHGDIHTKHTQTYTDTHTHAHTRTCASLQCNLKYTVLFLGGKEEENLLFYHRRIGKLLLNQVEIIILKITVDFFITN